MPRLGHKGKLGGRLGLKDITLEKASGVAQAIGTKLQTVGEYGEKVGTMIGHQKLIDISKSIGAAGLGLSTVGTTAGRVGQILEEDYD